jgi:type I restriction-modification system DNA methylase subunit
LKSGEEMTIPTTRESARQKVKELVRSFKANEAAYINPALNYNETEVRSQFIGPFFRALGWDVLNENRLPLDLREVIQEATVEVGEEKLSKKPDYEFRLARQRKFFVEAKKPSIKIERDKAPAFQTRRYGFSAGLPVSVLTNFHRLAIYDCVPVPGREDDPRKARLKFYSYEELESSFDELYDTLSREAVYSGNFDSVYGLGVAQRGTAQFDEYFLSQVKSWRERLAVDIHSRNKGLTPQEITYIVQRLLNKIIFLRICEDRDIEKYETLKNLNEQSSYDDFKKLLRQADKKYDSGLFRLIDDPSMNIDIGSDVLISIAKELYYPQSPYTFSVVEAIVLGDIYELLIAQEVVVDKRNNLTLVEKPEVKASGGVFTTPKYIVDSIVERTLAPAIIGKTPAELASMHIADICCGSGVFLLAAYDFLLNYHLNWYLKDDAAKHNGKEIYEIGRGEWRLTLNQKHKILLNNIFGVDIDGQAVEVARFSLLLKLIEDETNESIVNHLSTYKEQALPSLDNHIKCGNSLVGPNQFQSYYESADGALLELINPFDWVKEFPSIFRKGGFDIIVGNPPYIRIQNMVAYSPEEVEFYQSQASGYTCAGSDNFDKYALFVERGVSLLKQNGLLGYIVPHKFFAIKSGQSLRKLISTGKHLKEIVYFGVQQVFGKKSTTYTCILILSTEPSPEFFVEIVDDLKTWRYSKIGIKQSLSSNVLDEKAWTFIQSSANHIFDRLRREYPTKLKTVAEIFVGVQTSADKIYIVHPTKITATTVSFTDVKGKKWTIERDILRPSLLDAPLHPFSKPDPNTFIIFPYKIKNNDAELYSPDEMRKLFPNAWKYLNAHKSKLMDRNIQGGTEDSWYRYGRSQSLTKFNTEKIILPILSTEPRYAYDNENIVVTGGGNGPYYLIRPSKDTRLSIIFYTGDLMSSGNRGHGAGVIESVSRRILLSRQAVFGEPPHP